MKGMMKPELQPLKVYEKKIEEQTDGLWKKQRQNKRTKDGNCAGNKFEIQNKIGSTCWPKRIRTAVVSTATVVYLILDMELKQLLNTAKIQISQAIKNYRQLD